jgi:hypothetical protein
MGPCCYLVFGKELFTDCSLAQSGIGSAEGHVDANSIRLVIRPAPHSLRCRRKCPTVAAQKMSDALWPPLMIVQSEIISTEARLRRVGRVGHPAAVEGSFAPRFRDAASLKMWARFWGGLRDWRHVSAVWFAELTCRNRPE